MYRGRLRTWVWAACGAAALLLVLVLIVAMGGPRILSRAGSGSLTSRRQRYDNLILEAATRNHVPPLLVKAVIARESSFNPYARGAAGEIGLMQITAGAVSDWARITGHDVPLTGLLFDPTLNIEIGTWYLGRALAQWREYRDAERLALAQYNAGRERAKDWAPKDPREALRLSRISIGSTREYIKKVEGYWRDFEQEDQSSEAR